MSSPPTVSVLLANLNGGHFLDEAIASVARQTFRDWELIAVDTGSEDASTEILRRWAVIDIRIKPVFYPTRLLCPTALNLGIQRCAGRLIARIESDDYWSPEHLDRQVAFLDAPANRGVGMCGSNVLLVNEDGRSRRVKEYPQKHADCLRAIWYRNPFCHSSVLIRQEVFKHCGGYDPQFYPVEDLELWFRVGQKWRLRNHPEPLVSYRIWPGSLTSRRIRRIAWLSCRVRLRASRELGYHMPWLARVYSNVALFAALLPSAFTRRMFDLAVSCRTNHEKGASNSEADRSVTPHESPATIYARLR